MDTSGIEEHSMMLNMRFVNMKWDIPNEENKLFTNLSIVRLAERRNSVIPAGDYTMRAQEIKEKDPMAD